MNSDCGIQLTNADNCLSDCLDPCVVTYALDYASCFEMHNGQMNCNRDTCYTNLQSQFSLPSDFNYMQLTMKINMLNEMDLTNCNKVDMTVSDVCKVGRSCCGQCDSNLGDLLSCVINNVVFKIYGEDHYHNASYLSPCSVACMGRRFLEEDAADMTPRLVEENPMNHVRALQSSGNATNVTACANELKLGLIVSDGNATQALGKYVSCVVTTVTSNVATANATVSTTKTAGVGPVQVAASFVAVWLSTIVLL